MTYALGAFVPGRVVRCGAVAQYSFEHVADAFIAMLNGANTGKALIRLGA
ncbi:MAG TPA: hypothetical protein VF060_15510 [Trebonia sp.]